MNCTVQEALSENFRKFFVDLAPKECHSNITAIGSRAAEEISSTGLIIERLDWRFHESETFDALLKLQLNTTAWPDLPSTVDKKLLGIYGQARNMENFEPWHFTDLCDDGRETFVSDQMEHFIACAVDLIEIALLESVVHQGVEAIILVLQTVKKIRMQKFDFVEKNAIPDVSLLLSDLWICKFDFQGTAFDSNLLHTNLENWFGKGVIQSPEKGKAVFSVLAQVSVNIYHYALCHLMVMVACSSGVPRQT